MKFKITTTFIALMFSGIAFAQAPAIVKNSNQGGAIEFWTNPSGTVTKEGTVSPVGAWTLGSTDATTTAYHLLRVNDTANEAAVIRNHSTTAGSSRGLAVVGGTNASDFTQKWFKSDNSTESGKVNGAGTWTVGNASTSDTHSLLSSSPDVLRLDAGANTTSKIIFKANGSDRGQIASSSADAIRFNNASGTELGNVSAAGLWTLGQNGGVWTDWAPGWYTTGGTVNFTSNYARYFRIGKIVWVEMAFSASHSGANGYYRFNLPVAARNGKWYLSMCNQTMVCTLYFGAATTLVELDSGYGSLWSVGTNYSSALSFFYEVN